MSEKAKCRNCRHWEGKAESDSDGECKAIKDRLQVFTWGQGESGVDYILTDADFGCASFEQKDDEIESIAERIAHFKKKGGIIAWREDHGAQVCWTRDPNAELWMRKEDEEIFRPKDPDQLDCPPEGFVKIWAFFG